MPKPTSIFKGGGGVINPYAEARSWAQIFYTKMNILTSNTYLDNVSMIFDMLLKFAIFRDIYVTAAAYIKLTSMLP